MAKGYKKSDFRSEFRTYKGKSGKNYLAIRFKDDKNSNSEYHIYAEVIAKDAAIDIDPDLISLKDEGKNVRKIWDKLWERTTKV